MKTTIIPTQTSFNKEDFKKLVEDISELEIELKNYKTKSNLLEKRLLNFNIALEDAFDIDIRQMDGRLRNSNSPILFIPENTGPLSSLSSYAVPKPKLIIMLQKPK